jgi:outer membrane assembly lipoprotein YfiO
MNNKHIITHIIPMLLLLFIFPSCQKSEWTTKSTRYRSNHQPLTKEQQKPVKPSIMSKNPKTLSFEDLRIAKNYTETIGNPRQTIMYLENMVRQCSDQSILKEIYLELADLYFEQGNMENASKLYSSYITLYPGSPHRAYVHYQAILCNFYSTFSSDRDQTKTEETFKLTQLYLEVARKEDEVFKEFSDDVSSIQKQCCRKLYDHELDIFNFYYKKGNYKAAQVHLDEMKKTYISLMKEDIEPNLIALECDLATKRGDLHMLAEKQSELRTKYPQAHSIKLAANSTHKVDHVARF